MKNFKRFRAVLLTFLTTYTCTIFLTVPFCKLFTQPPVDVVPVDFLWQAGIFSLCALLPGAVYLSKRTLTSRQLFLRTVAHTVLLEIVLMAAGYLIGMYRGWIGAAVFFIIILMVDGVVRLVVYLYDRDIAQTINVVLRRRRREREDAVSDSQGRDRP